ncbi:Diacylglycerol kinase [Pontiella desulfatans]|uniref:Diacylglycerol kinase n=1 Tax=Pontiella desulfatans TaxID=2750659 RepID=A0A6C2U8W1_PONDE|nr:diacylglycerol kinase family protein [Pontiella desulfatans]VGO15836.1 Diacylglycerol kinase [Pontiella desulfatans]
MKKTLYIINPASNGCAGLKVWETFKSHWTDPIDPAQVVFTERPRHAREIAAECNGYDIIAAVGGDGTVGEVICGIMDRPGEKPRLAVIPCGTGNDVAQNAGIFSVADAATALRTAQSRAFDLIRIDRQGEHRHSFLFANAGFTSIPKMKPWMKRVLGATGAYYLATLLQVLVYRPPHMTLRIDGREQTGPTYMLIAGNAEFAGGGSMRIAPGARTDDGLLNISIIESLSIFKVITKLFSSIADGTHIDEPEVSYFTGRKIEVHSEPPAPLDLDGELFGTTPATFAVCPRAVEIICSA